MIPVYESFLSWQGEGVHFGRCAFFIRTFGCPVHCPWCDSAATWHPDYVPETVPKKSPGELVDKAKATNCDFVVITGGEPAIHDLGELTTKLNHQNIPCHMETSGGFEIKGDFQWVTLSPKREKLPLDENLKNADEIKVIVDSESAIDEWYTYLSPYQLNAPIWLNIEWSQRENQKLKEQITEFIKVKGAPYRVGYQFHKLFKADELDENSMPPVPLGGKASLGY